MNRVAVMPFAMACALAGAAIMLNACASTPDDIARAGAAREAFYDRAFLPGAPRPGEFGYDEHACGGDHGMLEEMNDNDRGRPHIGPPQMSICR
ncbi:MAG TPA: hypothetical protein VN632_11370 [Stellaceae bacterium]|nr:hypothetical protein [Stellaceae bacterium]